MTLLSAFRAFSSRISLALLNLLASVNSKLLNSDFYFKILILPRLLVKRNHYQIFVSGYPRSGNSFFARIWRATFPNSSTILTHIHNCGSLRWAAINHIPIIVLIRNPLDSISSLCLRYPKYLPDGFKVSKALLHYCAYYRLIVNLHSNSDCNVVIYPFEELIRDPVHLIMLTYSSISMADCDPFDQDRTLKIVNEVRYRASSDTRSDHLKQFPSLRRSGLKAQYHALIRRHPLYSQATVLFDEANNSLQVNS
jgi:hypothetical protein